jgi:peptidoglycan/xylan/chitin deacetylase (PgdA/CDA1 family)/SAM-dependent methyltransferase
MHVSIVIPAYNAADTIGDTLQSLLEQTFTQWEAIVVNDGSTDNTAETVQHFIARDKRIRIVSQGNQGLSGARNSGLALAEFDWLLFLDADDWIFPHHLERLTHAAEADPSLDIVYCGWTYALPDGEYVFPQLPVLNGDLFLPFTQYCVSVVHTFLVPRSLVISLGPFNTTMRSCEDWALWQRIARTGARFGAVKEVLAAYRTRPNSLSRNGHRLLKDGTQVLLQGHSPDVHVLPAHPLYPDGLPIEYLTKNKFDLLCACAGYLIGGGKDARSLLEILQGETCSTLKPYEVARCVLIHALVSASRPREEWHDVWAACQGLFSDFLVALEAHAGMQNLVRPSQTIAQKQLVQYLSRPHWQEGAPVASFDLASQKPFISFIPTMKQFVKRSLWTAGLMLPTVRKPMYWIKQSLTSQGYYQPPFHPSHKPKEHFEQLFSEHPDPWSYTNRYEQIKYRQTLDLIPDGRIQDALELACAEGHFTIQLAPRVKRLLATDISQTALDRCRQRCTNFDNVSFQCLDFLREPIVGRFDLILCSEVLYFACGRHQLAHVVDKIANALKAGGYLIMTHSNVLIDDPAGTGFNWDHAFGAKFIGETFASSPKLEFLHELETPLYRIQLFQRRAHRSLMVRKTPKTVEQLNQIEYHHLPPDIVQDIVLTQEKPMSILSYRAIYPANGGEAASSVTPEVFEAQLRHLRKGGYHSITLPEWGYSVMANSPVNHKSLTLVFDNAHAGFFTHVWPLLKKYGFSATVFLYADEVGKLKAIDPASGDTIPLMEWKQIRQLQAEGVMFGSHGFNRQELTTLSLPIAWQHIKKSKTILEEELGISIPLFAYPNGQFNLVLEYLVGLAGYDFAISATSGICTKQHSLLALPSLASNHSTDLKILLDPPLRYRTPS